MIVSGTEIRGSCPAPQIGLPDGLVGRLLQQLPSGQIGCWSALLKRPMGLFLVVLAAPGTGHRRRLGDCLEPVLIQALRSEVSVEALDVGSISWFSRSREFKDDVARMGPSVRRLRDELRTVVNRDAPRCANSILEVAQHRYDPPPCSSYRLR